MTGAHRHESSSMPQRRSHSKNNNLADGSSRADTTHSNTPTKGKVRSLSGTKTKRRTIKLACVGTTLLVLYAVFIYTIQATFDSRHNDDPDTAGPSSSLRSKNGVMESFKVIAPAHDVNTAPAAVKVKIEPTSKDYCGMCMWKGQDFNCNERVEWVVEKKGLTEEEARENELSFCVDTDGCNADNADENGFLICDEQKGASNENKGPPSYKVGTTAHVKKEPESSKVTAPAHDVKTAPAAVKVKIEPTSKDYCGMCMWKGQDVNCNERVEWVVERKGLTEEEAKENELRFCVDTDGCNADNADENGFLICDEQKGASNENKGPPSYEVGTTAHVKKEPDLEAILSGSLLQQASSRDITISQPKNGEKLEHPDEEGMRDRRSSETLLESVLTAAKYGDRQYDTEYQPDKAVADKPAHEGGRGRSPDMPVLTAYCEPVNQTTWETKPLPARDGPATKSSLFQVSYPLAKSCAALPAQWPINTPPVDLDPYLPWIHDVFPSSDGKNVVFVTQNRRRCYNGQRHIRKGETLPTGVIGNTRKGRVHIDYRKNYFMRPQSALFQHVPVKRIASDGEGGEDLSEPRYRLASHEEADADGMETRFICRFKSFNPNATPRLSIVGYSLSKHVVDYEYHTYRKGFLKSATEAGYDTNIWQSQLLFNCPVPPAYHEKVQLGDTVVDDYANLYVDVIPIRTPPRYTAPREFLQPRYEFANLTENLFIPDIEWGKDHVLPKIDESGRWENIPICMPSLMSYGLVPKGVDVNTRTIPENDSDKKYVAITGELPPKIHKVIACTWASTTFRTRSNRAQVGDGKQRLREWLEFNLLTGFDHIYVYDNSGAFTNEDSLADIVNLFGPEKVTRVDWPCKICSNQEGNEGERSSQYAAESSCRLRFGTHARWLGSFDTDEYFVPMGEHSSMGDVADDLDRADVKVATFKSAPAKPRFDLLEDPTLSGDELFTPTVTANETFLHTYNCNWEAFPRKDDISHNRKQMYRTDYVRLHFVHYSTITVVSQMTEKETKKIKGEIWWHRYSEQHAHEFDEMKEATMLHTKTKVQQDTLGWKTTCQKSILSAGACPLGFPFPKGQTWTPSNPGNRARNKYGYNCFINEKIEDYWWPKLVEAAKTREKRTI